MSRIVLLVIIPFLICIAGTYNTPVHIRLIFNDTLENRSMDAKYLWERKVIDSGEPWAEESTAQSQRWNTITELPRKIKVGLALAGGGGRGIAHIGVLRALEESNIPIHAIAGTSMGSIVGGLYACGYSVDTLEYMVLKEIEWLKIFADQPPRDLSPIWERLRDKPREPGLDFDFKWEHWWPPQRWIPSVKYRPGAGLRIGQNFTNTIAERTLMYDYYAGFNFDSLPMPYSVMLVNMTTRDSELKRKGTISTATRASGSMPMVFEPMKINGCPYVDGGVLDNLPVDAFIDFDTTRAPENRMLVDVVDSVPYDYIIGVHPIKRRDARNIVIEEPSLGGPLGISVVNSIMTIARDIHDWNSWDNADGKIDVDVTGGDDYTYKPLKGFIEKGYDEGLDEICEIKRQIVHIENSLYGGQHDTVIYRINSLQASVNGERIGPCEKNTDIYRAIRYKEGSYIQKVDVCDALKRLYEYGNFSHTEAKIEPYILCGTALCDLTFTIIEQNTDQNEEFTSMLNNLAVGFKDQKIDRIAGESIDSIVSDYLTKYNRIPYYTELKKMVEMCLVTYGYITPRVDSIEYNEKVLSIHVRKQDRIIGIAVRCGRNEQEQDTKTANVLKAGFRNNNSMYGYEYVLKRSKELHKQYFLKTIAVEDFHEESLIVACEKKASHTWEFPALSLENVEGLNFFTEGRSRDWFGWSVYINYAQNFPLKMAYEIPRGQKFGFGFQRCHQGLCFRCINFIPQPDISVYWQTIKYSDPSDSLNYNHQYQEECIEVSLPVYPWFAKDWAVVLGLESINLDTTMQDEPGEWHRWERLHYDVQIRWDCLDDLLFPEKGFKLDIDTKAKSWWPDWIRARARLLGAFSLSFQERQMIVVPCIYGSYFSSGTPQYEKYTLGGYTPPGSYDLRLYDQEDLIGNRRDMFQERLMWKGGCTVRLTLLTWTPMDLKFKVQLVGSYYAANACQSWNDQEGNFALINDIKSGHGGGFYLVSDFMNFGIMFRGNNDKFWDKFHYSLVFYGIGF